MFEVNQTLFNTQASSGLFVLCVGAIIFAGVRAMFMEGVRKAITEVRGPAANTQDTGGRNTTEISLASLTSKVDSIAERQSKVMLQLVENADHIARIDVGVNELKHGQEDLSRRFDGLACNDDDCPLPGAPPPRQRQRRAPEGKA